MIKLYYRKENLLLFIVKENPEEKQKLISWEGRGESRNNPEDVILSPALSQEQKEEMSTLLQKYKAVFLHKPGVAKGVMLRRDTGDVQPIAVTP